MKPSNALAALIFVSLAFLDISIIVGAAEMHPWSLTRHRKPIKLTTKIPLPNKTTVIAPTLITKNEKTEVLGEYYHPAAVPKPRIIERYDKRALDGPYEYRYVLSNGDIRYERAYWQTVGHTKVLARKGFYSYPLPNHRFQTVFYTADHNGFLETESTYSRTQPNLPRSLEIPPTGVLNEKSETEKKDNERKNRKLNWTPVTTTILQKGRIGKTTQEINAETQTGTGTAKATTTSAAATATSTAGIGSVASTAITSLVETVETSTSNITNRPLINIEASAGTIGSSTSQEKPPIVDTTTKAINPVKAATEQTATMETETAQLNEIDTENVLSVD